MIKSVDEVAVLVKKGAENGGAANGNKIFSGRWSDYPKVIVNGQEYAQVGNRILFSPCCGQDATKR